MHANKMNQISKCKIFIENKTILELLNSAFNYTIQPL